MTARNECICINTCVMKDCHPKCHCVYTGHKAGTFNLLESNGQSVGRIEAVDLRTCSC